MLGSPGSPLPGRHDDIITAWPAQSVSYNNTDNMGDSDMSPKARVTYDQNKFQVEFNVSEYLPEVRWMDGSRNDPLQLATNIMD